MSSIIVPGSLLHPKGPKHNNFKSNFLAPTVSKCSSWLFFSYSSAAYWHAASRLRSEQTVRIFIIQFITPVLFFLSSTVKLCRWCWLLLATTSCCCTVAVETNKPFTSSVCEQTVQCRSLLCQAKNSKKQKTVVKLASKLQVAGK